MSTLHRWRDTMAMYERALLHASSAINQVDKDLKIRLSNLVNTIESSKYCAHAQSVLEQDNEEELDVVKNAKLQKVVYYDLSNEHLKIFIICLAPLDKTFRRIL